MALHAILYADDVVLMAASLDHMLQTLQELKQVPSTMGLHLALDKCQFISSPGLDSTPLLLPDVTESLAIKHIEAVIYLGRSVLASAVGPQSRGAWPQPLAPSGAIVASCVEALSPSKSVSTSSTPT